MSLVDDDIDPALKTLLEDVFLLGVVVAAAAGNQQGTQRFVRGMETYS